YRSRRSSARQVLIVPVRRNLFAAGITNHTRRRRKEMTNLWQDVKFGFRMLLKSPGFTSVAILSLAFGIAATTPIFTLLDAVLFRPLNSDAPVRLAVIWEDATEIGFPKNTPAPANYADWKAQNQTFEDIAAMSLQGFNLTGGGDPERVQAQQVTADLLPMLGLKPLHGRFFAEEEDRPGANRVTILSYGLRQ